ERSVRARLLALSIAELVSSSWTELVSNPEPTVVPIGISASDEERKAARDVVTEQKEEREHPVRFVVAASGQRFVGAAAWLLGGAAFVTRFGLVLWNRTELTLGGEVGYALAGASGRVAGASELRIGGLFTGLALGIGITR